MYLLPQPKEVRVKEGFYTVKYRGTICIADASEEMYHYGVLLKKEIDSKLGFDYSIAVLAYGQTMEETRGDILLKIEEVEGQSKQSYHVKVAKEQISVTGYGKAGLLYGVQTLRQLLIIHGAVMPAMDIYDEPAILNRGFYQDVSRGRIPTLDNLKELADTCSFYKINQLQLYVEDSYLFEGFGETWRDNTPLTAEEIIEFDRYCATLQIELVPSLSSFGHLYGMLRTKQYRHLCELDVVDAPFYLTERMHHHTVDVSNEESFKVLANRIKTYMKLFRSNKFNICADETFDLGKGKSKEFVREKGETESYLFFLEKLCKVVTDAGKIPMFWGDIIVKDAKSLKRLPKESICLNWEYDSHVREDNTRTFVEAGAKHLYVCPGVQGWHNLIPVHGRAYQNILGMCKLAHKYKVEGVLNTCWGDLGHVMHPEFSTLGLVYGAAFSWSEQEMSEEEINKRISLLSYGDYTGSLVEQFKEIGDTQSIRWWNIVACKEWLSQGERSKEECMGLLSHDKVFVQSNWEKRQKAQLKLYQDLLHANESDRKKIAAYLLMAEGQTYLEKACVFIWENFCKKARQETEEKEVKISAMKLASQLEEWLLSYKKLWRSVSKESELHRVVDVICWYADYLREL